MQLTPMFFAFFGSHFSLKSPNNDAAIRVELNCGWLGRASGSISGGFIMSGKVGIKVPVSHSIFLRNLNLLLIYHMESNFPTESFLIRRPLQRPRHPDPASNYHSYSISKVLHWIWSLPLSFHKWFPRFLMFVIPLYWSRSLNVRMHFFVRYLPESKN